ncbi:hypothetical protein [uncultured Eudoraea sp.]|uniref:hypothetical protein n=1 Tax=uncultured Eudoraea sp. TaxID=1035614 RepID=UPI002617B810|nr:hypothetical protein [uncultured Eudoraea sp.]
MRKFFVFGITLVLLFSCGNKADTVQVDKMNTLEFDVQKLPKKSILNGGTRAILEPWLEFNELDVAFDALYSVENYEELILLIDEFLEKQNALASSTYPEIFDNPQVKSRQKVFKTYVLKVKATLEYRKDPMEATIEMVNAYNGMRDQLNVLVNSNLDTKMILDE